MMSKPEGWGREMGRSVFSKLLEHVERNPDQTVFPISLKGVKQIDYSFSSETVVQLARRFKGQKGFYLVDVGAPYIEENIDAAARRAEQPLVIVDADGQRFIGLEPSAGTKAALDVVVSRPQARAAEIAEAISVSVANASMKLKQLWTNGFLLRRESVADSGGVEFVYHRIA
jgi:hypothetical protein